LNNTRRTRQPSTSGEQGQGFVCVINRNRDGYQVPLALQEAGLLSAFVTDFYARDSWMRWLPLLLRARKIDGLPAVKTRSTWSSFFLQVAMIALKLPRRNVLNLSDRILAKHARTLAESRSAHLYCYASYVPSPERLRPGTRIIDFEFHPLPQLTYDTLSRDAALYPEVAKSFADEETSLKEEVMTDSWRLAEAVVCASNMTRRSLEFAGCRPELITVVPYGFRSRAELPTAKPRSAEGCRFLYVGQGIQRKGLHHLIRAWKQADIPDATLTLVCYRIDPGIAAMAEGTNIRLLGRQSREELNAHYDEADVFVMPSLVEGFGLVYLEAIEHGCHVIGSTATGLPDLPLSDRAMTLIEPGDIPALIACLRDLRRRKAEGEFSPAEIQAEMDKWTWHDFRRKIANHARAFLSEGAVPHELRNGG